MRTWLALVLALMMTHAANAGGGALSWKFLSSRELAYGVELIATGSLAEIQLLAVSSRVVLGKREPPFFGRLVLPKAYPVTQVAQGQFELTLGFLTFPVISRAFVQIGSLQWAASALSEIEASAVRKRD